MRNFTKIACACMCTLMLTGCTLFEAFGDMTNDPSCADFETNRVKVDMLDEEIVFAETNQPIKIQGVPAFVLTGIADSEEGCYAMFDTERSSDDFEELYFCIIDEDGDPVYSNSHMCVGSKYRIGFKCEAPDSGEVVIESDSCPAVHIVYKEVIQNRESEDTNT